MLTGCCIFPKPDRLTPTLLHESPLVFSLVSEENRRGHLDELPFERSTRQPLVRSLSIKPNAKPVMQHCSVAHNPSEERVCDRDFDPQASFDVKFQNSAHFFDCSKPSFNQAV